MRTSLLAVVIAASITLIPARACPEDVEPPCSGPEFHQLDFWVGEWDLTWEGGSGKNSVTRVLGDCVVREDFEGDLQSGPFRGHSVSVYSPQLGQWRQTWVDDQGGYLLFSGGLDADGIMRLSTVPRELPDGREQIARMSWVNVEPDRLDWHWEKSTDGGRTWEMAWDIHYERHRSR